MPFCAKRCDYCAFATWTDRHHLQSAYVDSLVEEVRQSVVHGIPVSTSVFFGGGTPSLLPADELIRVLAAVPRTPDAEVTVECNPDTVTAPLLNSYRRGGVTRISLGVQSMVGSVLTGLGRSHDPANVVTSVGLIRESGFTTFNLDLIYGAAGESMQQWIDTLDAVLCLDPPHVSAYALTVEAGTPLAGDSSRHPDDDDQADKYDVAEFRFGEAGLQNYEISNWAQAGHECRHNWLYWQQGDYRGYGCAAHSHERGRRYWNVRTPERYIALISGGQDATGGEERLDEDERAVEAAQLGLRTRGGVATNRLSAADIEEFVSAGLLTVHGSRAVLTPSGRMMANQVAVRLTA